MESKFFKKCLVATTGFLLMLGTQQALSAPGVLADEPLITSLGVEPNIMLLLDSSGSMQHIVVDEPYDPSVTYFNCPASMTLPPGQLLQTRILWNDGKTYYRYGFYTYDWGNTAGNGYTGRTKRCFDPDEQYEGMLYANADASWGKYANGYGETLYSGNYLNWYFGSLPNLWGSTARNKPGTLRRIEVERNVAKQLINSLDDVRIGLARFQSDYGARILEGIDDISTNRSTVLSQVDNVTADGSTPLAEAMHEIGRYFVQGHNNTLTLHPGTASAFTQSAYTTFNDPPDYSAGVSQASPIQHFCQKSFVVLLTDGRPTQDQDLSSSTNLRDYDGDCDGASPPCLSYDRKQSQVYDGGGSDYLDDITTALYDIDLRPDLTAFDGTPVKNNIVTYTIGFSDPVVKGDPLLKAAATQAGGLFFNANNAEELTSVFQQVTSDIFDQVSTAAAATFNSANLTEESALFLVQFNTLGWTGDLLRYPIDENGDIGSLAWQASLVLDAQNVAERFVFTYNNDTSAAVPFRIVTNLSAAQQADLNTAPDGSVDSLGQDRLDYLRGKRDKEGDGFRVRTHLLGDIVHSAPVFIGRPESGWPDIAPFPTSSGSAYSAFEAGSAFNRTPVVYVGDNSGMLQGYNADSGESILAYIPSNLFSNSASNGLHYLTDPNYLHRYYMDLSIIAQDVYIPVSQAGAAAWRTIIVAGQRGGGRGYVALDVTNPSQFTDANADSLLLWEFTSNDNANLGYAFAEPVIGLMNNGRWAAIFGNGYNNSGTGSAQLFIVFLDGGLDGSWTLGTDYIVIDTKKGDLADLNGLSSAAAIDTDGNHTIDRIYAGDLFGNLWAFDVSSASAGSWKSAYGTVATPERLFNAPGTSQAITTRPIVVRNPSVTTENSNEPNVLVLYGTGQYLTNDDKLDTDLQSFFGVWDHGTGGLTKADLTEQTITLESGNKRVVSNHSVPYADDSATNRHGWYIDFTGGERIVVTSNVRENIVFFNTLIPNTSSPCAFGGSGWIMALNYANGGEPPDVPLDINNDNVLDDSDKLNNQVVSGLKFVNGIPMQATLRDDYMFVPGSDGSINRVRVLNNEKLLGRISWHDLGDGED